MAVLETEHAQGGAVVGCGMVLGPGDRLTERDFAGFGLSIRMSAGVGLTNEPIAYRQPFVRVFLQDTLDEDGWTAMIPIGRFPGYE